MTKNKIVATGKYCRWQRETKTKNKILTGSINLSLMAVISIFLSGLFYLYSINSNAVKGYQIRCVEKKLAQEEEKNEQLRIREAELNSLYRLKQESERMNMSELREVVYIEESGPIALK